MFAILSFLLKCDLQQYFFNVAKERTKKKQLESSSIFANPFLLRQKTSKTQVRLLI
jgi:hypothetical protein